MNEQPYGRSAAVLFYAEIIDIEWIGTLAGVQDEYISDADQAFCLSVPDIFFSYTIGLQRLHFTPLYPVKWTKRCNRT